MPTIQITSPLPGDTVPTTVLVTGIFDFGGVGVLPKEPNSKLPASPMASVQPPPPLPPNIKVTLTYAGGTKTRDVPPTGTSSSFTMPTAFDDNSVLASLQNCVVRVELIKNNATVASDTIDNIDFAGGGIGGGGVGLGNSPGYP